MRATKDFKPSLVFTNKPKETDRVLEENVTVYDKRKGEIYCIKDNWQQSIKDIARLIKEEEIR